MDPAKLQFPTRKFTLASCATVSLRVNTPRDRERCHALLWKAAEAASDQHSLATGAIGPQADMRRKRSVCSAE